MGSRDHKIPLAKVVFELPSVLNPEHPDPDKEDVISVYKSCYRQVFGQEQEPTHITREQAEELRSCVPKNGMTLRLYILAAMQAFHEGSPDRKMYVRQILGPRAQDHVEMYRKAAAVRYGVFDMTTLTAVTSASENITQVLTDSEWLAASWTVNYRQKRGVGAYISLYEAQELTLDPRWLSTEPTYMQWLDTSTTPATEAVKKHRYRVTQAAQDDWRHERENILPSILYKIVAHHRHRISDFEAESPVTRPMAFWAALGDAILQYKIFQLLG